MTRILGIDQGTSATKAIVVESGRTTARSESAVEGMTFRHDAVEQDPEDLYASIVTAGREAMRGQHADVVGVGNQGETVLAWNLVTGRPLGPALSWQDRRSASLTSALGPEAAGQLMALTGLPLDPYFAAPKMAWLKQHLGPLTPDTVITTIDSWVLFRMTGHFVTDAATASRTMLMDPHTLDWSPEALHAFGLEDLALPRIVSCDAQIGETTAFGPPMMVAGAIVDQQASLLAEDCRSPGDAKCTYGTGAFLLANVGEQHSPSQHGLATSLAWAMTDGSRASCIDGQIYTVGAAVSWLERVGMINSPADLDAVGSTVEDCGATTFVPTLTGAGAPLWRPEARGAWTGLSLGTTRAHLLHSFCEGMAAQVTLLVRAVSDDLGGPLARLRVDGGLTQSHLLMQSQADLLGIPVEIYPHEDATALGVAALALRAIAGPGAEDDLVSGWTPARTYEPQRESAWADAVMDRHAQALVTCT